MTRSEAIRWYENLPDGARIKLHHDFDLVHDNLGGRENKFYRWIKSFNRSKQREFENFIG